METSTSTTEAVALDHVAKEAPAVAAVEVVATDASSSLAPLVPRDVETRATAASNDEDHNPLVNEHPAPVAHAVLNVDATTRAHGERDVHALLAVAAARQKTFQELREGSLDIGVRDMRKCDYPMTPVPRAPSARRPSSRRGSRQFQTAKENQPLDRTEVTAHGDTQRVPEDGGGAFAWRHQLDVHVAQLLTELRRRPDQLRTLLAAHYSKGQPTTSDEPVDDDKADDAREQSEPRRDSSVDTSRRRLHRHGCAFLSANDVYMKLTEIAFQLGETIYHQIRKMLLKSVKSGVIDRASNLVRLASMFKVELRRQVTLERLQQTASSKLEAVNKEKSPRLIAGHATKTDSAVDTQGIPESNDLDLDAQDIQHSERTSSDLTTVTTAHHFKMQALERVLANSSKLNRHDLHGASVTSLPQSRLDQMNDQIQDKVTAAVYSKNRENFPFWKDPPENALSREETSKLVRTVVSSFAIIPVFASLNIDQLIEVAKNARWKMVEQGGSVCVKDTSMDSMLVVMEGSVTCHSSAEDSTQRSIKRVPSRIDDRKSIDSSHWSERVCYGEVGLLSKTELWPTTLSVISTHARILALSRDAFDAALLKIFGGPKRQNLAREGGSGKRPTSSSALTKLQARSLSRPAPSSIREQAVAKFTHYRDEFVARVAGESTSLHREEGSSNTIDMIAMNAPTASESRRSGSTRGRQTTSLYQHYPTFPVTDGGGAGSHLLRLKCIQPIAFGMKSMEELIRDEWAPAFPDTSTLVDYMSGVESSFLFEKRNVLIKEHLRAVCTNLPFQDDPTMRNRADEYLSYYQDIQTDSAAQNSGSMNPTATSVESITIGTVAGSSRASAYAIAATVDGDPMTLGQFTDARRRISSKIQAAGSGAGSPSMRNVFASAATSATLAKHGNAPFVSSFFVPETCFHDDLRTFATAEGAQEDEDEDADTFTASNEKVPLRPETDGEDDEASSCITSEHDASVSDASAPASPTKARKMALESVINTVVDRSPVKKKMVDQEAARRVILQKHLYAANEGAPLSSKPHEGRKRSLLTTSALDQSTGTASHAPLPLRIDLQRRMEVVLATLKMKPKAKLDLVLKYTHADFYDQFPDAVVLWEQAAHYILKREKALETLRMFEIVASDPRRHFRSLSTHRLTEQKERDALFYQLNYASDLCRESLDELEKRCGDEVFMENRLYRGKMKKDYTELLYEVEQERLRMIYKGIHPVVAEGRISTQIDHPSNGNQRDETSPGSVEVRRTTPPQVVSGSRSTAKEHRFALSTPRESIYVSVVDHIAQEEREEQEQLARKEREKSTLKRPPHKLSAQVQQHRQAQLEGITTRAPHNRGGTNTTPIEEQANNIRSASAVAPAPPQATLVSSLKHALEKALSR